MRLLSQDTTFQTRGSTISWELEVNFLRSLLRLVTHTEAGNVWSHPDGMLLILLKDLSVASEPFPAAFISIGSASFELC